MLKWLLSIPRVAWLGATVSVLVSIAFALAAFTFDGMNGQGMFFYGTLTTIVELLIFLAVTAAVVAAFGFITKMPWFYQMALVMAWMVIQFIFPGAGILTLILMMGGAAFFPSLLGGTLASLWKKQIPLTAWSVLLGIVFPFVCLTWLGFWLIGSGSPDGSHRTFKNTFKEPLTVPNPSHPGKFKVSTFFYGSGSDFYRKQYGGETWIRTDSVDGSPFISGWDGWTGWLRSYFWGFDESKLPLNGRVWLPQGKEAFPLILLVHGNHTMSHFSDEGYDYLGTLLATQGFIVVSVDENFLNSSYFDTWSDFNEVPARGWLLLEHLALWKKWNETPESPFYGLVDMKNIGLIGHSRGGEAIVTAYAFNPLPYFPDDGRVPFDYHFSIKALAAIAPKDGQYLPTGISTPLENVNYFVMHGSHDGDVRSFEGTKAYSRLQFTDGNYWFKSALYIVGANHGQFNEVWDRLDSGWPDSLFLNLQPLLSSSQQHQIAEVYLSAFMKAALKNQKEYIPLFWDARLGKKWLPNTLFLTQFEDSKTAFVYSGKLDLYLNLATLPGSHIEQEGLSVWKQQRVSLKWGDKLDSAIFAGWENQTGSLTFVLPVDKPLPLTEQSILTFSLADANESSVKEETKVVPDRQLIDLTVQLIDRGGQAVEMPLSWDSFLYPQITSQVYKADFLDTVDNSEAVFQTFRFPVKEFIRINPLFDVHDIQRVRFIFNKTPRGVVIFDRVGFDLE